MYYGLIIVDIACDEPEVGNVATVEHINDVTNEEWYRAEQSILQDIADNCKGKRNGLHLYKGKVNERDSEKTRQYITNTAGDKADDRVKEIFVHVFSGLVHNAVGSR